MSGKVVVNRCMSLDGFIAGPGHSMDWGGGRALADFVAPADFAEIAAATGAMLVGRRTWEVGARMAAENPELSPERRRALDQFVKTVLLAEVSPRLKQGGLRAFAGRNLFL